MVPGQIQWRHSAVAFAVPQADLDISGRVLAQPFTKIAMGNDPVTYLEP